MAVRKVPVYCYQCPAGPDLLKVVVQDGVAVKVEPNTEVADRHPAAGRICVKAYGLIHKLYNPARVKAPLKRTNPRKGQGEDPQWVEIGWQEALDLVAEKLRGIRAQGLVDEQGYPRLAVTMGAAIPPAYLGTFAAFFSAWGPVDFGIGSGQGVKCHHSEHLYGELWHRAYTVAADTPLCSYVVSFGDNVQASGGVTAAWRHAEARARGLKRVQFEPHLSVTGATSQQWVPIKPKTDAAALFAMLHVILHEMDWTTACDVHFLKRLTNSPYLVGPHGYYMRDRTSRQPLIWDEGAGSAKPYDDPSLKDGALVGEFLVEGIEVGPDGQMWEHTASLCQPAFQRLLDQVKPYTPEWAGQICDVPSQTLRMIAQAYVRHAMVDATIMLDGETLPYRPVAVVLGKTVTNGWGGYECCWARTVLACLVGALEVPGGVIGTAVRINRPASSRLLSVKPGPDGFMDYPMNPTDRQRWQSQPTIRNAYRTLVPLSGHSPWSPSLGPAHFPWLFLKDPPERWPKPTPPDVWIVFRSNPTISQWDSALVADCLQEFPFIVAFAYTPDETNRFADVLLPESTDLESYQLYRVGGTKYIEAFWQYQGFALRQPVATPPYNTMDMTDIATELAARTGLLPAYHDALNRGIGLGAPLHSEHYDHALAPTRPYAAAEIWDRACRAVTRTLTGGREERDLRWFREHGVFLVPLPKKQWYLHPAMVEQGLRYEIPYQERLKRVGEELRHRLHEQGIQWWDAQLEEYQALPSWHDFPDIWATVATAYGKRPQDYPFWLLTSRSMQYAWGSNVSLPIMADVAQNVLGHFGVMINRKTAREMDIEDGDEIWIESPIGRTKGRAILREGIRPDVAEALQQFGHWATPFAKELGMPNLNQLCPMGLALTDATGSGADLVKVKIYRVMPPCDFESPSPPRGGRWGWGEEALAPPPPEPSPIKGEGQFASPSKPLARVDTGGGGADGEG